MNQSKICPVPSRVLFEQLLSDPNRARANDASWRPFRAGIEIMDIHDNGAEASSSALLRYQAGATVPRHRHAGYEHILVLSGSQSDENGVYRAGDMIVSPPGSSHSIRSDEGCVVLAIWERGVVFD